MVLFPGKLYERSFYAFVSRIKVVKALPTLCRKLLLFCPSLIHLQFLLPLLLNQTFKSNSIQFPSSKSSVDKTFETLNVLSEEIRSLVIQWIVRVWLIEQIDQAVDDCVDVQDRPPVLSQNIQAHLALQINVWMVNVRLALDFGWGMGVVSRDGKNKFICGAFPVASIGGY